MSHTNDPTQGRAIFFFADGSLNSLRHAIFVGGISPLTSFPRDGVVGVQIWIWIWDGGSREAGNTLP